MPHNLPDFIYVGTGKVATTWLFERMQAHPGIYITPTKETNFFDLNYQRGEDWYAAFFQDAQPGQKIGEISHRYLHRPETVARIAALLPEVRIIIGLREPVDYCVSDYLFTSRNGRFSGDLRRWCDERFEWDTIEYRKMIEPFVQTFGRERIHVFLYDDVKREAAATFAAVCRFLGVEEIALSQADRQPVNSAAKARNRQVALVVNRVAKALKRRGGQRLIAAVKHNPLVQKLLFKPLDKKPDVPPAIAARIRDHARDHAAWLDETFSLDTTNLWKLT